MSVTTLLIDGGRPAAPNSPAVLTPRLLDADPHLLEASYRLRFQVYCHERHFLAAADYPSGVETDAFDQHAIHVGAIDGEGVLAGTARIVLPSPLGLPLFDHLSLYSEAVSTWVESPGVVELSRMAVSRSYLRRVDERSTGEPHDASGRHAQSHVFLTVMATLYQVSKRAGVTHWLVAIERSLNRLLVRHGFPFRQIGPFGDYFGPVAAYGLEIAELDELVRSGRMAVLAALAQDLDDVTHPPFSHAPRFAADPHHVSH